MSIPTWLSKLHPSIMLSGTKLWSRWGSQHRAQEKAITSLSMQIRCLKQYYHQCSHLQIKFLESVAKCNQIGINFGWVNFDTRAIKCIHLTPYGWSIIWFTFWKNHMGELNTHICKLTEHYWMMGLDGIFITCSKSGFISYDLYF